MNALALHRRTGLRRIGWLGISLTMLIVVAGCSTTVSQPSTLAAPDSGIDLTVGNRQDAAFALAMLRQRVRVLAAVDNAGTAVADAHIAGFVAQVRADEQRQAEVLTGQLQDWGIARPASSAAVPASPGAANGAGSGAMTQVMLRRVARLDNATITLAGREIRGGQNVLSVATAKVAEASMRDRIALSRTLQRTH